MKGIGLFLLLSISVTPMQGGTRESKNKIIRRNSSASRDVGTEQERSSLLPQVDSQEDEMWKEEIIIEDKKEHASCEAVLFPEKCYLALAHLPHNVQVRILSFLPDEMKLLDEKNNEHFEQMMLKKFDVDDKKYQKISSEVTFSTQGLSDSTGEILEESPPEQNFVISYKGKECYGSRKKSCEGDLTMILHPLQFSNDHTKCAVYMSKDQTITVYKVDNLIKDRRPSFDEPLPLCVEGDDVLTEYSAYMIFNALGTKLGVILHSPLDTEKGKCYIYRLEAPTVDEFFAAQGVCKSLKSSLPSPILFQKVE